MFSKLFGPPSWTELEDLDKRAKEKARSEAATFEEEILKQEGVPDTGQAKMVYPTSTTISHTIGIPVDYFPTTHQAKELSKSTGQMVGHMYYHCTICSHRSQNQDSTYTHTHRHLNVVIGCAWPNCTKTHDTPNGLNAHVNKVHGGLLLPGALSKDEAEAVVASLSMAS